jgi:hypothetical protein
MAKGATAKAEITKNILERFPSSFLYNDGKEIRIPFIEDGEEVQIKVTLTCAKENVSQGQDNAVPGEGNNTTETQSGVEALHEVMKDTVVHTEPTAAEKQNVSDLLRALGL